MRRRCKTINRCKRIVLLSLFYEICPPLCVALNFRSGPIRTDLYLRPIKSRGYLETRVQLDHARQRERREQRVGRHRALQNSR
jgi:hypothetical protein